MKLKKLLHQSALLAVVFTLSISPYFNAVQAGQGPQPSICVRSCWGARAQQCNYGYMSALTRATIHHTAGTGDWSTDYETSKAIMRNIQNYHMDVNGWCDIAYHFLVNAGGYIYEGRTGSMSSLPIGTHDAVNTDSFGFTWMGWLDAGYNGDPPVAMRNAMYDVIAWRMPSVWSPYGSGPYGGRTVGFLCGHRDAYATACPGNLGYSHITSDVYGGEARNAVNARKNPPPQPHFSPAICSRSSGKIDVFGLASDGTTLQIRSWDGAVWSPWYGLGSGFTSGPAAVSRQTGWVDVVARKADNAYYLNTWNGSVWSGFYSIGGSFSSSAAICTRSAGKIDVFGLASDNTTIQIRSWDGAAWSPWYGLGSGFTSAPAATSRTNGWIDVVARKADNAYYLNTWNGSVWSGFYSIDGSFSSSPALCSRQSGKIDVFGLGSDLTTLQIKSWDGSAWSVWYGLGSGFTSGPGATSRTTGWLDVVARGSDASCMLNTWNGTAWSGWYSIGGSFQ